MYLDAGDFDFLWSTTLLLLSVLFLAGSDESGCDHMATQRASRSLLAMRRQLSEAGRFNSLWNEALRQSFNVLYATKKCLYFMKTVRSCS